MRIFFLSTLVQIKLFEVQSEQVIFKNNNHWSAKINTFDHIVFFTTINSIFTNVVLSVIVNLIDTSATVMLRKTYTTVVDSVIFDIEQSLSQ